eukprot:6656679-Lingulodinium_polyedra.AAC.1
MLYTAGGMQGLAEAPPRRAPWPHCQLPEHRVESLAEVHEEDRPRLARGVAVVNPPGCRRAGR